MRKSRWRRCAGSATLRPVQMPRWSECWSECMSDLIAVIAPGEMGAAIGQRLRERGARVVTSLLGRSPARDKRAERAGMAAASDAEVVKGAIIPAGVPPQG